MKICDFCKSSPTFQIYFSRPDFLPTISKDVCRECFVKAFGEDGKDFIDYFFPVKIPDGKGITSPSQLNK